MQFVAVIFVVAVAGVLWCMLNAASDADDEMERMMAEKDSE